MILYKSTRRGRQKIPFSEAVLKGQAPDGGLFMPEKIPNFSLRQLEDMTEKSYQKIALAIFQAFETDFSPEVLRRVVTKSYGANFDDAKIAPVVKLKTGLYLVELWHGPTAAFKDIALQIQPHFFQEALKKQKNGGNYLILAATSGDTGKAALEGYKDLDRVSVIVLYPKGKVSKLQELQMTTQPGKNLEVIAVEGNFDVVQKLVKNIFADKNFNKLLIEKFNTRLSSANSINWGRLMPQIVYYFTSYMSLVKTGEIKLGDKINIAVPTGNFGNILAAFLAKKMGLPVGFLISSSNSNNSVAKFFETGIYSVSDKSILPTLSPAMDILMASNIERLLYFITEDAKTIRDWMDILKETGKFSVGERVRKDLGKDFFAASASDRQILHQIKKTYSENGYLIDPHTAVAVKVTEDFRKRTGNLDPVVVCSTAHWSKFPGAVFKSLDIKSEALDEFSMLKRISELKGVGPVPNSINATEDAEVRFKRSIEPGLKSVHEVIWRFLADVKT